MVDPEIYLVFEVYFSTIVLSIQLFIQIYGITINNLFTKNEYIFTYIVYLFANNDNNYKYLDMKLNTLEKRQFK